VKILLLNQAFYPDNVATSQYVTDIAHELSSEGHEITLLCARRDYTEPQRVYPRFEVVDGIRIHRVGSTRFGKKSLITRILDAVTYGVFVDPAAWRKIEVWFTPARFPPGPMASRGQ
jgi:hypothetical protein